MDYPEYKNEELKKVAKELSSLEHDIETKYETLKGLGKERDSLEKKLSDSTYEWLLHYEIKVKDEKKEHWIDYTYLTIDGKHLPYFSGRYAETEEEAMVNIMKARKEVVGLMGKEAIYSGVLTKFLCKIVDYEVTWAQITKGKFEGPDKKNIVYKEGRESHLPRGDD